METAVNKIAIAIAGCGAVCATGMGLAPLQRAVAANASALQSRELVIGKTSQSIVAGFVPDEIVKQLRAADVAHADSRAFLFAAAALEEATKKAEKVLGLVHAGRRGFVLSTTKANIEALETLVRQQPVSAVAQRQIHPAFLAADLAAAFDCRGPVQSISFLHVKLAICFFSFTFPLQESMKQINGGAACSTFSSRR